MIAINNAIHTLNQAVKDKYEDVRQMTIQIEKLRLKLLNIQELEIKISHLPDDVLQNIKSFLNIEHLKLSQIYARWQYLNALVVPKRDKIAETILQVIVADPAQFEIDTIKITAKTITIKWTDDNTRRYKKDDMELILNMVRRSDRFVSFRTEINKMTNKLQDQYLRICYNYSQTERYMELRFDGKYYIDHTICRTIYDKKYIIGCDNIRFDRS